MDTDSNTTGDILGDHCDWYDAYPDTCGMYDDDDFWAGYHCCACDGGYNDYGWNNINLKAKTIENVDSNNYDFAIAAGAAIASVAVFGWTIKEALSKRKKVLYYDDSDVFSKL